MVVVNLYPFVRTVERRDGSFAEAIEMIDIGGPSLLRAAAKNHRHVLVVNRPEDYASCLAFLRGELAVDPGAFRRRLAARVFHSTAAYDTAIEVFMTRAVGAEMEAAGPAAEPAALLQDQARRAVEPMTGPCASLRYGENPHQEAVFVSSAVPGTPGVSPRGLVSGETLSFNNYVDGSAALGLCSELARSRGIVPGDEIPDAAVCAFVKHTNPCGVGVARDPVDAYRRAYLGDPHAAMGGVLACSFAVRADFARVVMESLDRWGKAVGAGAFFAEVWLAPSFEPDAVQVVQTARPWGKRVRLVAVGALPETADASVVEMRHVRGGMLVQMADGVGLNERTWTVGTRQQPSDAQMRDLRLAWLICKHTKSNAITICRDGTLIGNGAGQMSRVMSCRVATWLAKENGHAAGLSGAAAASDAFFPFPDGPDILMDAGVTAIIQPGGSKRDAETIAACNARGVAMVLTQTRHFRH
jgi:phosphoribosylaminoimidazolecarboxamide formyltransferase/IMP cyclohydrolase